MADVPPLWLVVRRATVPVVLNRLYNTNPVVHYVVLAGAFVWYLLWRATHPSQR